MFKSVRAIITTAALIISATIIAATLTHRVQPGETAYSIAKRYGVALETLYKYNPQTREGLRAGDVLVLPDNGTAQPQEIAPEVDKAYHTIERGESLFGIAKRYGMTVDELMALNPHVNTDGYTAGTILRLRKDTAAPAARVIASEPAPAEAVDSANIAKVANLVKAAKADNDTPAAEPAPIADPVTVAPAVAEATDRTIVVMLPLMSEAVETKDKTAQHSTDFVRGLLIAADTLSHNGADIRIIVCDTHNSVDSVRRQLRRPEIQSAAVIIAPSDTLQLQAIAANAGQDTWVLNPFAVKDDTFLTNPRVIQANIPHDEMYGKAIDTFMNLYTGFTPVFLTNNNEQRNDKAEFTRMLRSQLQAEGRQWVDVNYNIALTEKFLEDLDPAGRYVFVPASSSKGEFNHYASTIKKFADANPQAEIRLFGYPEYVTFKGATREALGDLNATIYSRFFLDDLDYNARKLAGQFAGKYGREMLEVYPSQAVLGYDLGRYLIAALRSDKGDGKIGTPAAGVQTPIHLDYDAHTGPVNTAIYIITFTPGGFAQKSVK